MPRRGSSKPPAEPVVKPYGCDFYRGIHTANHGGKEPTLEELEEMRKKEARKDRLHQNYLKRKANGK